MPEEDQRLRLIATGHGGLGRCGTGVSRQRPGLRGQDCEALWFEHNTYYKQAGYCFRTRRAIQSFGNAGCCIHDEARIRFAPHIRRRIDELLQLERVLGCPR